MIAHFNLAASIVASISAFILGAIWYSPFMFGKIWLQAENLTKEMAAKQGHPAFVYPIALLFLLFAAIAFSLFLGKNPSLNHSVWMGFYVGLFFVATSFGINYIFAARRWKLLFVDAGYHIVQFVLYGVVFGLWHRFV